MAWNLNNFDFSNIGTIISYWVNFILNYDYSKFMPYLPIVLIISGLTLLYWAYRLIQEHE